MNLLIERLKSQIQIVYRVNETQLVNETMCPEIRQLVNVPMR